MNRICDALYCQSAESWAAQDLASTMAKLIYTAVMSLNGYVADKNGNFDRAQPAEELH